MLILFYSIGLLISFYAVAKICDEYFVKSLDIIGKKWKLTEDVAGATLMAVGSSAPEFFTATIAIFMVGSEQVGAGTIVGSAIFNILVIIGGSALVATAYLKWQPVVRDMGFYIIAILVLLFTFMDGVIHAWEAGIYVIAYVIYILLLSQWNRIVPSPVETQLGDIAETVRADEEKIERKKIPVVSQATWLVDKLFALTFPKEENQAKKYWVVFWISIAYIIFLSWVLVEFAVGLSHEIGIPEVIIALTVLAAGTSLPDLLSSLIVAKQGRGDMAVSNAVGSNVFDILICLGLPWLGYTLIKGEPIVVGTQNLTSSIFLLFCTVIAIIAILTAQKFRIGKYSGYGLIGLYGLYVVYMVTNHYFPGSIPLDAWVSGFMA
jgi:K+-dependent Na+/Ca+ exchanger-like protein